MPFKGMAFALVLINQCLTTHFKKFMMTNYFTVYIQGFTLYLIKF
jgi:hypothetical protein